MISVSLRHGYGKPDVFSFSRDDILVGSSDECDLVIRSDGIDARHIRVRAVNGAFVIEDPHGVRAPSRIAPNDTVRVGGVDLWFRWRDFAPEDVTHPTEQRLLDAILARPDDQATRSVYADWLEGRGDVVRAEFLRAQLTALNAPDDEHDATAAAARIRTLSHQVGAGWRARVATTFVENCPSTRYQQRATVGFEVVCPMRWDRLTTTHHNDVRYCHGCKAKVTYCESVQQARVITDMGGCVSIDVVVLRTDGDLKRRNVRGMMALPFASYGIGSEMLRRKPTDKP